ncbi:hypothetical protein GXW82_37160 [Streptacidiphilus sp. 4-A2]|nr:hypothetical protein [Streptacidiphilus sp. 4-A2]
MAGFGITVVMVSAGVATVPTFVGLPLLAAALIACRGFGAMERARAAALLDLHVPEPEPVRQTRPGLYGRISATLGNGAGWRAALYNLLMLPLGIISFTMTVVLWSVAVSCASYPLWQWVFPRYVHHPGIELYENNNTRTI